MVETHTTYVKKSVLPADLENPRKSEDTAGKTKNQQQDKDCSKLVSLRLLSNLKIFLFL